MPDLWLSLKDIPAEGRDFSFPEPADWAVRFAEFGLPLTAEGPLALELNVRPQGDAASAGALVSGRLTGTIVSPCDRCAEVARMAIDESFEQFEAAPGGELTDDESGESHVAFDGETPRLNVSALAWEQLMLALPVKPLCDPRCKGLCPKCGANLNAGPCGCADDEGDPRLAVLRGLKITPKQ